MEELHSLVKMTDAGGVSGDFVGEFELTTLAEDLLKKAGHMLLIENPYHHRFSSRKPYWIL